MHGARQPSRALPSTRSGSVLLGASARGGGTWSKKPPHSSWLSTSTVFFHAGLVATALYTCAINASPLRISECGWLSFAVLSNSVKEGSTNDTSGRDPLAQSE